MPLSAKKHRKKLIFGVRRMKRFKTAILGATGTVGQTLCRLLENHPLFQIEILASSARTAGMTYAEALSLRAAQPPPSLSRFVLLDTQRDADFIANNVDFVFSVFKAQSELSREIEESYAQRELPVVSTNSASRALPDVPVVIPEINPKHLDVIDIQRRRLGTRRGFIAAKCNCSVLSFLPLLTPLIPLGLESASITTLQAVSGAGNTLSEAKNVQDNVVPFIDGEEEKCVSEPLKICGTLSPKGIVPAKSPLLSAQCFRVPVSDGHTASVGVTFSRPIEKQTILSAWQDFSDDVIKLHSSPQRFIRYFPQCDRPQPRLDRTTDRGMSVCVGRLRKDALFSYKFVSLSHNTLRGAAGGAILLAELLEKKGYLD